MVNTHHIQTQRIVLEADTLMATAANKWHQRLERLQDTTLQPALERQLDRLCPPGETIVLERVEVTLPIDLVEQFEQEVPAVFAEELRLALRRAVAAVPVRTPALRLLIDFLHSGRFDWRAGDAQDFGRRLTEEASRWNEEEWTSVFEMLSEEFSLFFGRLTQVQGKFQQLALMALRKQVVAGKSGALALDLQVQGKHAWQRLLPLAGYVLQVKDQRISQWPTVGNRAEPVPNPILVPDPVAEYFPPNAGLVILHPYFGYLAKETDCITDEVLDCHRMATLLHYAVSGTEPFLEWEHSLTKVLLGQPPEMPLLPVDLTATDREAVDELLRGIIEHWAILKNTSPGGLRSGFLRRPGKLYATPGSWQLLVENRGHDLLLAHLPWGISMVKTPWMAEMLQVSWS